MQQKRWALSVPLDGLPLAELAAVARDAEELGYTDAWSLEIDGIDCFAPLAVVGVATQMRVGTAIVNAYTRGPATLAMSAAGLAEIVPRRFCLGIGAGSQAHRRNLERGDILPPGDTCTGNGAISPSSLHG